ncbi:N/A [soil metagenome]
MRRGLKLCAIVFVVASCKRESAPAPAPAASDHAKTAEVTIDPALVREGRVVVEPATTRAPRGLSTVPGAVEAGEAGEGEATSLVSGRIASLPVKVGDTVTKGQTLATIESADAGRAQADLLRARGRAVLSARALGRQLELEAQEATSKAAIDQARAEDQAAKADLAAARAVLSSIGASEPTEGVVAAPRIALRAPIAGVVVARTAVLGGPVSASSVLFRIVARDHVIVVARLPETSTLRPRPADPVSVSARRAEDACAGSVERVLPIVDDARTRNVRITVAPGCELVPGSTVEVRFHDEAVDGGSALYVATAAIVDVRGVISIFVSGTKEGSFVLRPVRLGASSGDETAIASGLADGEHVVVSGALLLKGELLRQELQ